MAEQEYQNLDLRFAASGLDLASAVDAGKAPHYPLLVNLRSVLSGEMRARPALNTVSTAAGKTPWHSVRRLNDKPTGNYTLVAGIGTELLTTPAAAAAAAPGNPVSRDTGYSGNPLSMLPYRPENDVAAWMAVADANKMRKVRLDGTVHRLGLPAPTVPPTVYMDWGSGGPQRIDIEDGTTAPASWIVTKSGGPIVAAAAVNRANVATTIGISVWGDGPDKSGGLFLEGWKSIEVGPGVPPAPSGLYGIGPGTLLKDAGGGTFVVEEVHPATPATTSILQVLSSSSFVTVIPNEGYQQFRQHAIVRCKTGGGATFTEGVIVSAVRGAANTLAVKFFITSGTAPTAGVHTIEVVPTLYGWDSDSAGLGGALTATSIDSQNLGEPSVQWTLTRTPAAPVDLTNYPYGGKQVDFQNDEMHISVRASDWSYVDSIKIELDVQDGAFTGNYFSRTVRQADLLAFQQNEMSAPDARVAEANRKQYENDRDRADWFRDPRNRKNINPEDSLDLDDPLRPRYQPYVPVVGGARTDDPGTSSSQGSTGLAQWSEIRFKLSDLKRFGEDMTLGLQKVYAMRLLMTTTADNPTIASGNGVDITFGSWWIGGGSAPDVGSGMPYEYRYRYTSSVTGARSDWSPAPHAPASPHRNGTVVYFTTSAVTEVDRVDIQRRGGTLPDWVTIGSTQASLGLWRDGYDDLYALGAASDSMALEGNVNTQPFPVVQSPFSATGLTVCGSYIHKTGAFTAEWLPGAAVICNGSTSLLRQRISNDLIEVYDNLGYTGTGTATIEIPAPEIVQPLPVIFGDVDGWYFACGDPKNPGRLYAFNNGTLDSTRSGFYVDMTSPAEPLQNGCVHMGRAYVWSSDGMFALAIDPSVEGAPVRFERLTSASGMFSRYALATGEAMYWLGKDGVYASDGGGAQNITAAHLAPLFPSKQLDGTATNGIPAPAMTPANAVADGTALHQFRLSYVPDGTLWFDYIDTGGARRSLGMMRAAGADDGPQRGWWYDDYVAGVAGAATRSAGVLFHYASEGENIRQVLCGGISGDARLYAMGALTNGDDGNAIACEVRTFAFSADRDRATSLFGDVVLDINPAGVSTAVKVYTDNWSANLTPAASPLTAATRTQALLDINSGSGVYARNLAIGLTWSVTATATPVLYRWGVSVMGRPDDTGQRATDYTDCGYWGPKEFLGCALECDADAATADTKTVLFEYTKEDGTVATVSVDVVAARKTIVPVTFTTPFIGYEIRLRPSDTDTWKLYGVKQWHFNPLNDLTPRTTEWDQLERLAYIQGVEIYADTGGAAVSVSVQKDFGTAAGTLSLTHAGRGWKSYSFAAPFLAYMLRLVPAGNVRLMKWRWHWRPEASLGDVWEAQEVEIGDPYGLAQALEVEYCSTSTLTLKYYVDGTLRHTDAATLTSTGSVDPGTWRKVAVQLPAWKGRLVKLRIESASQFRLRAKGTVLYVKSYGSGQGFAAISVLGDLHHDTGATV